MSFQGELPFSIFAAFFQKLTVFVHMEKKFIQIESVLRGIICPMYLLLLNVHVYVKASTQICSWEIDA